MDKSEIYKNKITKKFNNNKYIYNSAIDNIKNNSDVRGKINNIIKDNNFIYSKLVHIVINKNIVLKKIIGIYKDNVVTIDNEYIPISSIDDIYN